MSTKITRIAADEHTTHEPEREPVAQQHPHAPRLADPRSLVTDGASAPVVYFDGAPVFAVGQGVASVTLTAQRQMLDPYGQVYEDRIITGLLRAPLSVMLQLREAINEIERLAKQQAEAALAEAEAAATVTRLPN